MILRSLAGLAVVATLVLAGQVAPGKAAPAIPFEAESHIAGNPFFAPNATIVPQLEAYMDALRKSGDSCGARLTVTAFAAIAVTTATTATAATTASPGSTSCRLPAQ